MATWPDFRVDSVQAAIFTPDHSAFATNRALSAVLREYSELFDGEMQVLPIPAEVSPEIPRVTLQSSDGRRRMNMAPSRIDAIWSGLGGTPQELPTVAEQAIAVVENYASQTKVRVGRVGMIVHRICPSDHPAEELIRRFCNEASQREPFNRSAAFEIHNHKQYQPRHDGIDCRVNSWVRCRSGVADNRPAILVSQDLNTLSNEQEQRRFGADQIGMYFRMAMQEANDILQKYFPQ